MTSNVFITLKALEPTRHSRKDQQRLQTDEVEAYTMVEVQCKAGRQGNRMSVSVPLAVQLYRAKAAIESMLWYGTMPVV